MTVEMNFDLTGLKCPMPIVALNRHIKSLTPGDTMVVVADDPAFCFDVRAWCDMTGNELVQQDSNGNRLQVVIRKNQGDPT